MSVFFKNILTGALFLLGLLGFISGEFIISSILFTAAVIVISWEFKRTLHESAEQPTSIKYLGLKPVTSYQAAVTLPTISWPGTIGNITLPYSLRT